MSDGIISAYGTFSHRTFSSQFRHFVQSNFSNTWVMRSMCIISTLIQYPTHYLSLLLFFFSPLVSLQSGAAGLHHWPHSDGHHGASPGDPRRHDPSPQAPAEAPARQHTDSPHGRQHLLHLTHPPSLLHQPLHPRAPDLLPGGEKASTPLVKDT